MPSTRDEVWRALAVAEAASSRGPRFAARAAAIELLEIHVFDRLRYMKEGATLPVDLQELGVQAATLRKRLEAANEEVVRRLARQIRSRRFTPEGLRRVFARSGGPPSRACGYDALDVLVVGLLGIGALPQERATRAPEMVAYQPTPARAILALVERAQIGPGDVFFDLGSGLGWVVILVALLSGARAKGIEFEPAYCEYAERAASRLNVSGVEFVRADARVASLAGGTVFFLYTPFRGALLQRMIERLRSEATVRPIRVCTLGPCTAEVAAATWLRGDGGDSREGEVAVFRST
jgi:hypothetical protein